jgi:hypothetical protein
MAGAAAELPITKAPYQTRGRRDLQSDPTDYTAISFGAAPTPASPVSYSHRHALARHVSPHQPAHHLVRGTTLARGRILRTGAQPGVYLDLHQHTTGSCLPSISGSRLMPRFARYDMTSAHNRNPAAVLVNTASLDAVEAHPSRQLTQVVLVEGRWCFHGVFE